MHPPTPMLEVDALKFAHPGLALFDGLSARFPAGVSVVCGGDGRGKTTLLRLLAGDLPWQAGRIRLDGREVSADSPEARARILLAGADSGVLDQVSAREHLVVLRERWPAFDAGRCDELVQALALAEHLDKRLFMLSTGSRRKLGLVGAIAACAAVTLIDDPFGALDRRSIAVVEQVLADAAWRRDRIWVVADHAPPLRLEVAATLDLGE